MSFAARLVRLLIVLAASVAVLSASAVVIAPRAAELIGAHVSDHATISLEPLSERSYVYDRFGNLLGTLVNEQNRVQVKLSEISKPMIKTVIAIEDEHFYSHHGVNVRSIARAFSANLEQGGVEQGGSTITQQLVKNSIVGTDRSISRKMREAVLAVELEKEMTKDQILERYLNTIYFGNGAYGVQAAAELYFNVNAKDLDWVQAALLTALIRNPNPYDPFTHPEIATERRSLVLDVLVRQHLLTRLAADWLGEVPLPTVPNKPKPPDDYFVEEVKQQLLDDERLGATPTARYNAVFGGGLRIYTTFDPALQFTALLARRDSMEQVPGNRGDGTFDLGPDPQTGEDRWGTMAMAGVEPTTGAVRMLVGGPGFDRYKYDLATQGSRQPGSSFKTFLLTEAMEQGYSPTDQIDGHSPCNDIPGYPVDEPPKNFGGSRGGVATLTSQTLRSSNCAFLRLGQVLGMDKVVDLAKRMGITSTLTDNPSAAIGGLPYGVHPLDMAAAYSVLANDGVRNPPYFIDRVTDAQGRILFEHRATPERIVAAESARLVTDVLIDNVRSGTGTRARLTNGQDAAGKTGTTNGASDVWFVGYTPQLAVSVWMGAPTEKIEMSFGGGATGGRYPAYTWGLLMNAWMRQYPITPFAPPEYRPGGECLQMPGQESCYGHRPYRDSDGDPIDYTTGTVPFPSEGTASDSGETGGR
jgi:penicillin-binding protein 1A